MPVGEGATCALVLCYSFTTQITVGYGDMAPAHPVTRTVSVVQAVFGVMYIAILISRFVSIHLSSQSPVLIKGTRNIGQAEEMGRPVHTH